MVPPPFGSTTFIGLDHGRGAIPFQTIEEFTSNSMRNLFGERLVTFLKDTLRKFLSKSMGDSSAELLVNFHMESLRGSFQSQQEISLGFPDPGPRKLENIGINWKTQLFSNYSNFPLSFQIFKLFPNFLGPELGGALELQKSGNNLEI